LSPPTDHPSRQIIFHIPLTIKRRYGRKQISTPDGNDLLGKSNDEDRSDSFGSTELPISSGYAREPLSIAVARAHRWLELIEHGDYPNVQSLARAIRLDRSYVHRLLRLTLLKPEHVEALLNNREPEGMSIEKLWEIPEVWGEQGMVFGDG
jgi:hypothetical protein